MIQVVERALNNSNDIENGKKITNCGNPIPAYTYMCVHAFPLSMVMVVLSRFSYLNREYNTVPTANHYTNANQCSSQTNSLFTELQSLLRAPEE